MIGQDSILELALEDEVEWVTVRAWPPILPPLGPPQSWDLAVKSYLASIGMLPFIRPLLEEIEVYGIATSTFMAVAGFEVDVPISEADGLLLVSGGEVVYET